MRRVLLALAATLLVTGFCGCHTLQTGCGDCGCASCDGGSGSSGLARALATMATLHGRNSQHNFNGPHGPPTAQTTYPYYTLRGPRDFLLDDPPGIGP